jgi:ribosome-associated translation inhibitor RaiA
MQIIIRGQNVPVSETLARHCIDRVQRAFRPSSLRIARVHIVFVGLSAARQGLGHACRVTVDLRNGGHVRYESRAEDYYQCALQTITGAARHVQRALERRRIRAADRPNTMPPAA